MLNDRDNRERIFKELVGVSAYYKRFTKRKSDLMLYIAFNEATFGGNPSDEVSFTLKLRKAEFFILIEDNTLKIDPSSIWMPDTDHGNDMEQTVVRKHGVHVEASADMCVGADTCVGAGASAGYTNEKETTTKRNHKLGGIKVSHHPINEYEYCWTLNPYLKKHFLQDGAWNGSKKFLTLVDKRTNPKHVLSSVKLIVRCKRKDLHISSLKYLDKNILKKIETNKKKKIAMEMIKKALINYELMDKKNDISPEHAIIPLANILVKEE